MRKWRPTHKCLYVVSEIHGNADSLSIMLDRILPLRKFKNQEDIIVFMGDYIDVGPSSNKVIDILFNIKSEYPDRTFFLKGNHEEMFLRSILSDRNDDYIDWVNSIGSETVKSYLNSINLLENPYSLSKNRLLNIMPSNHIDFLSNLSNVVNIDNYLFFHGSFNPLKDINENDINNFIFDYSGSRYVKTLLKRGEKPLQNNKYIYVGAHNYKSKKPFIYSKYFMLGGGAPKRLFLFELNSMSACSIKSGKNNIYKYNFNYYE